MSRRPRRNHTLPRPWWIAGASRASLPQSETLHVHTAVRSFQPHRAGRLVQRPSATVGGPTRALTARHPIKLTSPRCHSAWQPNRGRRSTYRRGKTVQTTETTSAKTGLHDVREMIGSASMLRTGMLASLIFGFISVAVSAEEAQQLMCTGMMIEPSAMSQSPETVTLTLGPAQKITLDLGQGAMNARRVSDNKIQLKFRTKDFEGEYFHYTGDLFFIYKSGHLMKLTCQKRENVGSRG